MNGGTGLLGLENYPIVPLEELCDLCSGITKGRKIDSTVTVEVPYMAVANVQDGSLKLDNVKKIEATPEEIHRYRLLPGDLLLTEGGDPDKLGRGAIWNGEITSCIHQNHIFRARKASEYVDMEYLAHLVSSPYGKQYFLRQSKQTTGIASINMGQLKRFPVPLPPLEEQRRIAAILDKAGQLTKACASLHAARRQLGESLFVQAFGDPRLNPLGLPSMRLGEIVDCQLGKMLDKKRQNGRSQRPYLRNANIRWFEVDTSDVLFMDIEDREMERFGVRRGDLLVCEGGEPGRAAIWSGGDGVFGFQKALHRLRPDKSRVLPEYLNWVLWVWSQRGLLGDHITSATIAHLTREKLVKINVLLPPLAVQERFVRELQMLDVLGHSGISRNKLICSLNSSLFSTLMMRETG
jgi:type I restriction enzyme S subunit